MKHTPAILSLLALFSLSPEAMADILPKTTTICDPQGYGADYYAKPQPEEPMKKWGEYVKNVSKRHIELRTKEKGIRNAQSQREAFFLTMLKPAIELICEQKREADQSFSAYEEAAKTIDQCSAQEEINQKYSAAREHYEKFSSFVEDTMKRRKIHAGFDQISEVNKDEVQVYLEKLRGQLSRDPTRVNELANPRNEEEILGRERALLWSTKIIKDSDPARGETQRPEGVYSAMLAEILAEQQKAKYNSTKMAAVQAKTAAFFKKCAAPAGGTAPVKAGDDDPTKKPPVDRQGRPVREISRTAQAAKPLPVIPVDGTVERTNEEQNPPPNQQVTQQGPPAPPPGPPPPPAPPPPPPKVEEESFLSKNKGTIIVVGAGAAAVGGVLYYKNQQDKKAKREQAAIEAEAQAAAATQRNQQQSSSESSGGTSESSGGDERLGGTPATTATPPGSILIVTGVPSGAEVNSNISQLTVAIVNPSGILTSDSNTRVTLSCVVPSPCPIAGTLSATSSNGRAVFTDVRFTTALQGVKLKVSAPGFADVTTTSPFNVTQ